MLKEWNTQVIMKFSAYVVVRQVVPQGHILGPIVFNFLDCLSLFKSIRLTLSTVVLRWGPVKRRKLHFIMSSCWKHQLSYLQMESITFKLIKYTSFVCNYLFYGSQLLPRKILNQLISKSDELEITNITVT